MSDIPPPPSTPPPQNAPIPPITGTPPAAVAAAAAGNAAAVSALPQAVVPEKDRLPKEGDEIVTETGRDLRRICWRVTTRKSGRFRNAYNFYAAHIVMWPFIT